MDLALSDINRSSPTEETSNGGSEKLNLAPASSAISSGFSVVCRPPSSPLLRVPRGKIALVLLLLRGNNLAGRKIPARLQCLFSLSSLFLIRG